ncbi:hypothetical protein CCR75_006481 [Bremia lactucae]|uniref:Uncharacterized protein n=1 Tax=Bremia lactucae TaxID=4779 RepID=A0A976FH77_BRELC|nr:hypothetical protein CCR75_006481 [Bremia lactucae]
MSDIRIKQERSNDLQANKDEEATDHEVAVGNPHCTYVSAAFEAASEGKSMERLNALLVHACSCDHSQCPDQQFNDLCSHMKRFLRAACWASHNERWLMYPVATAVVELFAYHALHCQAQQCDVPMCRQLRN